MMGTSARGKTVVEIDPAMGDRTVSHFDPATNTTTVRTAHQERVAYVDITSFRGISFGAAHWYLSVTFNHERVDVERKIGTRQAAIWNRQGRGDGDILITYRAEHESNRFDDEETAEIEAVRYFREKLVSQGARLLLRGSPCYSEPMPVLAVSADVPEEIVTQLRALAEVRTVGRGRPSVSDSLNRMWEDLVRRVEGELQAS